MTDVRVSIQVDREPTAVFAFLADMANNPQWQNGMKACTWTSEPPLRLGSTYDQEARFLGKSIVSSFEVTEFESGRTIRIVTTGGSMPIDVTREVVAATGGGSTVSAHVRGDASGVFRFAGPLLDRIVKASVKKDYGRLKALLEAA